MLSNAGDPPACLSIRVCQKLTAVRVLWNIDNRCKLYGGFRSFAGPSSLVVVELHGKVTAVRSRNSLLHLRVRRPALHRRPKAQVRGLSGCLHARRVCTEHPCKSRPYIAKGQMQRTQKNERGPSGQRLFSSGIWWLLGRGKQQRGSQVRQPRKARRKKKQPP